MRQVIPTPHQSRVLHDLTAQPIEFYMKEVEVIFHILFFIPPNSTLFHSHSTLFHSPIPQMLHQHVMKSLSHHDFPVTISVFRLIKHMQSLLPEYRAVLHVGVALI